MNTDTSSLYGLNAYKSHELSISMRTSSGDEININLENTKEMSLLQQQDGKGKSTQMSFSSMQAYQFEVNTNGIDEQDKKEIAAFMEIAKPYIEGFMKELEEDNQTTPLNKVAQDINQLMNPMKSEDNNKNNFLKESLVKSFDETSKLFDMHEKMLEQSKKLLDKVLSNFESLQESFYV